MVITLTLALGLVSPMQQLSDAYLKELWKSSPQLASQVGYHGDGVDARLDDLSFAARQKRTKTLTDLQGRLTEARSARGISQEDVADYELMREAIALEQLELDEARDYSRRCDLPLDSLGSVFFAMVARPYAPVEQRASDVLARLLAVPHYLDEAQKSLTTDVEIFREAARDDGDGLVDYFEHELLPPFAKTAAAPKLKVAVADAVKAVRAYLAFVDKELTKKPKGTFRYGAKLYEKRFRPYLTTDLGPKEVLAQAEKRLVELHAEMAKLAKQLVPSGDVKEALSKVADDHPKPSELFSTVRKQLETARAFVVEKKLMTLSSRDNLKVIETPAFLRSQLGVAAFDGAPPLQPELGAFYYVTPFPSDWPKEKVEAKLREYNRYMLELLTIHEAMPGHYVQFERANELVPETRRVLRWVLGAGSYVEGWAVYAQDLMVDAGYLKGDPKLRLQQYKLELRSVSNAILDIKLHTEGMSDEAALRLMTEEAFQERPEAELKLKRAKLSVTQLCSYFVGGETWRSIRKAAEKAAGNKFDLRAFHDRALGEGAVTLPTLRTLLAR